MKSYISRKFPLETRITDQSFDLRSEGGIIGPHCCQKSRFSPPASNSRRQYKRVDLPNRCVCKGQIKLGCGRAAKLRPPLSQSIQTALRCWSFLLHLVADHLGLFLELRFLALFVREDNAD